MSVFVVFALALVLAVAAKKHWLPGQRWLLQYRALKKQGHDDSAAGSVEIVVDKSGAQQQQQYRSGNASAGSNATHNGSYADKLNTARKSLLAKPSRYEGPPSASAGSAEGAIRSALNELRSRQVVKNLCSQFEARVARKSVMPSENDDEETCIRAAANGGDDDEYLLPAQSQQLRRDELRVAPAPYTHRRGITTSSASYSPSSAAGNGPKPNNLHAFLRRYSSNMDRANIPSSDAPGTSAERPSSSSRTACPSSSSRTACPSSKPTSVLPVPPVAAATAVSVPAATPSAEPATAPALPSSSLTDIDLFDLQSSAAADDNETSNQCDSPVRANAVAPPMDVFEQDEPADTHDSGDWDVTPVKRDAQSPEENSSGATEDKALRAPPAVPNSVARFQQFQLQIPANHARLASTMTTQ